MKNRPILKNVLCFLVCIFFTAILLPAAFATSVPVKCERYTVRIQEHFRVPYSGQYAEKFPKGISFGAGSGLCLKQQRGNGLIEFYTVTDRGPNTDGPKYLTGDSSSKLFPTSDFVPSFATLRLIRPSRLASISRVYPLKNNDGSDSSGLPIPPGLVGSTNEIPLDDNFSLLPFDENGIDPEGIAVDAHQNFWICDEYGPFILKYDRRGVLLEKYAPGQGLPEVLKHRIPNRGFEGITIAPNGKVYAAVQSVLDINGETSKKALFTRIIELDPTTG
ncbi:MAG: esterase-like activity of phytase family protein, partial [Desulfobacterota bacterium]|nr:esterase-like activity of phytase family protein [Thermodesulfobacteriota bacterium]